ncbi:glycoside hydrolase family 25 protein [Methyloligella halotolerans]|uniref:glycoside hydrolase family 25 protein n=1 Tax=Methyloligella halotolerans TaxID=1177755 RepID=UPI003CC9C41C
MLTAVRIFIGAAVLTVAVAVVAGIYLLTYRPDASLYPVRGIDVSHHQGDIDWDKVAADNVAFAYMKSTEGGDWKDRKFLENWKAAKKAGIATGAYHFFTLCRPGKDQAENFLATLPKDGTMLPPAVDLEYVGNCKERPTPEALKPEVDAFFGMVEEALGREAIIYAPEDFLADYGDALPDRPLWRRSVFRPPHKDDWLLWQYTFTGFVDGIEEGVDLNVLKGDEAVLSKQLR